MHLLRFFIFLALISCGGPQLVPNSTEEPTVVVPRKKESLKTSDQVPVIQDGTGVFDDEKFQIKTNLKVWKIIDDKDGIKTYEKIQNNSGLVAFRGETIINKPLKKIATVLVNDSLQKEWVDGFVESKVISRKSDSEHIQYNQTKVPWPFQNRDFLFRVNAKIALQPPTLLIAMKSVEDSKAPPVADVVRGEIEHSYYYLVENSQNQTTKMVVEMEVDPKGVIPQWMVNLSQKVWPHNTLSAVRRLAMREDIGISPKVEKYFEVNPVKAKGKKK